MKTDFIMILEGPPGCGKTTFVDTFRKASRSATGSKFKIRRIATDSRHYCLLPRGRSVEAYKVTQNRTAFP